MPDNTRQFLGNLHFLDREDELRYLLTNDLARVKVVFPTGGGYNGEEVLLSAYFSRELLAWSRLLVGHISFLVNCEDDLLDVAEYLLRQRKSSRKLDFSPWQVLRDEARR
jgi:hypothetical protein